LRVISDVPPAIDMARVASWDMPANKPSPSRKATSRPTRSASARSTSGFGLKADLLVYAPKLDLATAQSLVEAAHKVCPYSNATPGNIEVGLSVVE
jgi:organic hydroperoxide reductase OsmC/OhrA